MPKRKISYLKRSVFWPCGECRQNCTKNSVQCDSCNLWYHYDCQQLSLSDIDVLVNTLVIFCCLNCLREEVGRTYSYSAGLLRLNVVIIYFIISQANLFLEHMSLYFKVKCTTVYHTYLKTCICIGSLPL